MYLPFKPVSYSMSMAHNTNDYNHIDKKSNRLSFFWRLDLRKAGGSFFGDAYHRRSSRREGKPTKLARDTHDQVLSSSLTVI